MVEEVEGEENVGREEQPHRHHRHWTETGPSAAHHSDAPSAGGLAKQGTGRDGLEWDRVSFRSLPLRNSSKKKSDHLLVVVQRSVGVIAGGATAGRRAAMSLPATAVAGSHRCFHQNRLLHENESMSCPFHFKNS